MTTPVDIVREKAAEGPPTMNITERELADGLTQPQRQISPCPNPWCQCTELEIRRGPVTGATRVACDECGIVGPVGKNETEALAAWNARLLPQPEPAAAVIDQVAHQVRCTAGATFEDAVMAGYRLALRTLADPEKKL